LDPITTEVIINRIRETTAAMAHALFHSGYSPILRESQDGTAGLCDANGRVIMVGGGLQYHSLLYTRAVESVIARYPIADIRDVEAILRNNSRVPEVVVGDLRGQVGSTRLGAERLCALCDAYGAGTLRAAMASLIERTAARVRGEFAQWPDGEHEAEALLDHD